MELIGHKFSNQVLSIEIYYPNKNNLILLGVDHIHLPNTADRQCLIPKLL